MSFENDFNTSPIKLDELTNEIMSDLLTNCSFQKLWTNLLNDQLINNKTNINNENKKASLQKTRDQKITKDDIIVKEALSQLNFSIQLVCETFIKCCKLKN